MTHLTNTLQRLLLSAALVLGIHGQALAADPLDADIDAALQSLYQSTPAAKALSEQAKGVLAFPNIVKAGFVVGAQSGEGALIKNGNKVAYYRSSAISAGMQAGYQTYGYALFFMSDKVLKDFEKSKGWEIGVGPSIVVVDAGAGKDLSTLTGKADVYAFIFDQKGLMAGVGIKGAKITKIKR